MKQNNSTIGMQRMINKVCFATLLVIVGLLLLGFNLHLIPIALKPILISWKMLLIVLGICALLRKGFAGGTILILVGGFFLLPDIGALYPNFMGGTLINARDFWPVLLIIGGLFFLFGRPKHHTHKDRFEPHRKGRLGKEGEKEFTATDHSSDFVEKDIIFGSCEQIVLSSNLEGGDVNVMFGEIKLDLRKVTAICEQNELEVNAMFGSSIIYLPTHWQLNLKASSMFGDVQDKRETIKNETNESDHTPSYILNLKAACLFGNIEIRN